MDRMIKLSGVSLVAAALLLVIVACAGMKKSPEDKKKEAFDDFRAKVADVIDDPEREGQAIALVTDMQKNFFDVRDANAKTLVEARKLYADYDASREDFEAFIEESVVRVRSQQRDVVDANRQLRTIVTEEEWDAIDKSRSRALMAAVKAIRAE